MTNVPENVRGRGATWNPHNRFEALEYVCDEEYVSEDDSPVATEFFRDPSRTIINYNDSPDVGFDASINPYRGCEHGCIYCFARPSHEYLGFSAGLDFETKIMVKEDAPELLRKELMAKSWKPQTIAISGVTDCYQPIEKKLKLTRRCLEVLAEFRNPVIIITKSHLVSRDVDVLAKLARYEAAAVMISITTLDSELQRTLEPRAATPRMRLEAVRALSTAGVPVGVMVAPIIPAVNDHEIPAILNASAEAGARDAGYTVLRLPWAVAPLFERWLDEKLPDRKEKVLSRIRDLRCGKMNDPRWGSRIKGEGVFAKQISSLFRVAARRAGLDTGLPPLSAAGFRRPGDQLALFG